MRVRNVLEPAVKSAVTAWRDEHRENGTLCRCPLCDADVTALALTKLPPQYATDRRKGCASGSGWELKANEAVTAAAARVARRPSHPRLRPEPLNLSVSLVNYVFEELALTVVRGRTESEGNCCCELCTADAMAYTLNRYPPKYGVILRGSSALPERQRELMRQELGMVLSLAAEVVAKRPRHRRSRTMGATSDRREKP